MRCERGQYGPCWVTLALLARPGLITGGRCAPCARDQPSRCPPSGESEVVGPYRSAFQP